MKIGFLGVSRPCVNAFSLLIAFLCREEVVIGTVLICKGFCTGEL